MTEQEFRDPRNGPAIEAALAAVDAAADRLVERMGRLDKALAPDIELTPDQADRLVQTLGAVGMLGAVILQADLARTMRREAGVARPTR